METQVAKIVATPTAASWSQAYNAGTLFAVLSLESKKTQVEERQPDMPSIGKEILNTLETEYFTLETKNLDSIKQAITQAYEKSADKDLAVSLVVASAIDTVLYIFISGCGKILMQRQGKLGVLLSSKEPVQLSASGFLRHEDTVILETPQFAKIISQEVLHDSLQQHAPSEIAENLSPKIHEQEEGAASAVIFSYKEILPEKDTAQNTDEEYIVSAPEKRKLFTKTVMLENLAKIKTAFLSFWRNRTLRLTHRRKVFLSIACILIAILIFSAFFAVKKQRDTKNQVLLQEIIVPAQKKYDEGQSLLDLNKQLAREDLTQAQKILADGKGKFEKNSKEITQIDALLKKINDALAASSSVNTVDAKQVDAKNSLFLTVEINNHDGLLFTQDDKNIYGIDNNSIFSVEKKTQARKTIIKNNDAWSSAGGIGIYFGNIYMLDKKSGTILKFTATDNGFEKNNYLITSQDFSKASSLGIDGSVWVLLEDGLVKKFTRGKLDDFKVSGLDTPLAKPSRIYTDLDSNNVYILDNGNSRIVVLAKNGSYQTQYQTAILKNAKDFEVLEKDKKIFVLNDNKVWQIDVK